MAKLESIVPFAGRSRCLRAHNLIGADNLTGADNSTGAEEEHSGSPVASWGP